MIFSRQGAVRDLGVRERLRMTPGQKLALIAGAAAAAAFPAWLLGGAYLRQWEAAISLAQDWRIAGPPCPELSRAEFDRRRPRAPKGLVYGEAVFFRQHGHMDCALLRYGSGWGLSTYPACQFTSPGVLRVRTQKGEWFFAPGPGKPATVSTPGGRAKCVVASNFRLG